jgi:acetyl esterase
MAQLDPQAQELLEAMRAFGRPPVHTLAIGDARRARRAQLVVDPPRVQLASVEDDRVPGPCGGTPVRWYRPSAESGLSATLYFHGGGWTVEDLDTHDHLCRRLAGRSRSVVVSVGYRQGPAHRYPAAVEDAYAAVHWLAAAATERGVDPTRVAVAGDSAGANLATVVALLCRDRRGPAPRFQALAYPVTDHWQAGTNSYRQRAEGYTLTQDFMKWSFEQYLPDGFDSNDSSYVDAADPYLFPLRAPDLSGLPPALIFTAEFDPLRDEGRAYAQRLQAAGVAAEHIHFEDQMHGFLLQELIIDRAREAVDQFADALHRALA